MGDVAASGGYYIASPAYKIFAEPTTITGSIGVFGMIPYTGKMFNSKLGITFDRATTNPHAVMSTNRKLTNEERSFIQEEVDKIYAQFLSKVAEGRGMTIDEVNKVARGRVWTGKDAMSIGLVDQLGGLHDAIHYAAKKAKIQEKRVLYYPLKKADKFTELLEELEDEDNDDFSIQQQKLPAELLESYRLLKKLDEYTGVQMRLPFFLQVN